MAAIPAPLEKGDKVAIVSSARKITEQELSPAIEVLKSWGLEVICGENLFTSHHQFAGEDKLRINDLQQALNNPEIKAIICARGGYGTVRLIDEIDFTAFQQKPKWIVGYSDITALHSHIHSNFHIATLHASMPINFGNNSEAALQSLKNALWKMSNEYTFPCSDKNRVGQTKAVVIGGNLSMLYSLRGTPSDIDTNGKILFLEDLDEYLYHIDRMMMNLKRGGMLHNLAGLIIGGMTEMNDNTVPFGKTAEEIIWEHVQEYNYPVCFNFPAGHIHDNRAIVMGMEAELHITRENSSFSQTF